jgi:peptide/nickel transport system permease protein
MAHSKLVRSALMLLKGLGERRIARKLLQTPTSVLGLALVLGCVGVAVFAPFIAPPANPDYAYMIPRDSFESEPQPPRLGHLFGTTEGQYDIFYGVVWGTRTAFRVGLTVVIVSVLLGITVGTVAAYYGGLVDEILMRIVDIFMTMPFLLAAMVLVTILGAGLDNVMIAMIGFGWMTFARLIRGDILTVRESEYVSAARAIGASDLRIMIRHILPNAIFPTFVMATMDLGSIVLWASSLSFLGLGAPVGYADWGQMISFSRNWMLGTYGNPAQFWYTVAFPGLAIMIFVLGWNLLGDALRDILDPRMRGVK